jgi:hypothetical protein
MALMGIPKLDSKRDRVSFPSHIEEKSNQLHTDCKPAQPFTSWGKIPRGRARAQTHPLLVGKQRDWWGLYGQVLLDFWHTHDITVGNIENGGGGGPTKEYSKRDMQ